jgi:hypothetical protein
MPIKAENMGLYPGGSIKSPEWIAIREQVRLRAHDMCEECGVVNGSTGVRVNGIFHATETKNAKVGSMTAYGKIIRIVCTVAHVDNQLVDHSLDNLRFWCQRCHLLHDRKMRKAAANG